MPIAEYRKENCGCLLGKECQVSTIMIFFVEYKFPGSNNIYIALLDLHLLSEISYQTNND